jgi:hypothetical protein
VYVSQVRLRQEGRIAFQEALSNWKGDLPARQDGKAKTPDLGVKKRQLGCDF